MTALLILFPLNKKLLSVSLKAVLLCVLTTCFHLKAQAQITNPTDSANQVTVQIVQSAYGESVTTDSGSMTKLVGNVILQQGTNTMYCDSSYINLVTNNVQAWGNVRITQTGGSQVESDYLRYTGNTRQAYLSGNVALTDGKSNLWTEQLTYNTGTKVGVYSQGGTLENGGTTVSSNSGMYNLNSKDSRFTGNVYITDPRYTVSSDDLGYNTNSEFVSFYKPSVVYNNDGSVLRTSKGTYDGKNGVANFTGRTAMQDKNQYIEGDRLLYSRMTRKGEAHGQVITIDTAQHITLWCEDSWYNGATNKMLATGKPVLRKENGKDSLYIAADTFYTAPDVRFRKEQDTNVKKIEIKQTPENNTSGRKMKNRDTTTSTVLAPATDSIATYLRKRESRPQMVLKSDERSTTSKREESSADSALPRHFIAYHRVRIFSDSLQGRCDSLSYSQGDSIMRMMYAPVVWSRNSQITGDSILLYIDTSSIRKLYVPEKAIVISRSGPEKANLFDQVQGKTLTAYFLNNDIEKAIVYPSAEAIYFAKDDNGAYLGVNQSSAERMTIGFANKEMNTIKLEQEVVQSLTPLRKINLSTLRLSRFSWREKERPKTLEEIFE